MKTYSSPTIVLLCAFCSIAVLTACGDDAPGTDAGGPADAAFRDAGSTDGGPTDGGTFDSGPRDGGGDGGADAATTPSLMESEPNDGMPLDAVDDLPIGVMMAGAIQTAADVDIFRIPTVGGRAYRARLVTPSGSPLMGHLSVLDTGRDGEAAGADYVHISRTGPSGGGGDPAVEVDFIAMGDGHYVAVRDLRSVGGAGSGGADHQYALAIEEIDVSTAPAITLPTTVDGALSHPGAMIIWRFSAMVGADVVFDSTRDGDMDGRLFVVAASTGDWIARNDDRGPGSVDPLIDAPLTVGGDLLLVLDNIEEEATGLGFSIALR